MQFSDIVRLIMKETGKGYAESAKILDEAIHPVVSQTLKETLEAWNYK